MPTKRKKEIRGVRRKKEKKKKNESEGETDRQIGS
jgi:hypothetical protein